MVTWGKYHDSFVNRTGPGDARPTAMQIMVDEKRINDMAGKIVVITGANAGMGLETVKAIHAGGATIFALARRPDHLASNMNDVRAAHPSNTAPIYEITVDQNSLASVRNAASVILHKSQGKVNIIINNAGIMACPQATSADGFESQFAVNHLSHFLLFHLLKPALLAASTPEFNSRVISVSSIGHQFGAPRLGDYNFEHAPYNQWAAYGQSKTANIWFAHQIARRYGQKGIQAHPLHPGGVVTGLYKHMTDDDLQNYNNDASNAYMKNAEQGAATQVWAAVARELEGKSSGWLSNCEEWPAAGTVESVPGSLFPIGDDGFVPHAFDEAGEKQLWRDSCLMVGVDHEA